MERYANPKQLADNIRRVRKIKGLSQKDVAEKMQVSRTLITAYESGSVYPPNLSALADAMGVDVKELILLAPLEHGVYDSLTDDLLKIAWLMDDKETQVDVTASLREIEIGNGEKRTGAPIHRLSDQERAYVSKQLMTLVDVIDLFAERREIGTSNNTQETDIDRGN